MTRSQMIYEAVRRAMGPEGVRMLNWWVTARRGSLRSYPCSLRDIRVEFAHIADEQPREICGELQDGA